MILAKRAVLKDLAFGARRAFEWGQEEAEMNIKSKLLAVALIAGGTMFAETRFSIGVGIGAT